MRPRDPGVVVDQSPADGDAAPRGRRPDAVRPRRGRGGRSARAADLSRPGRRLVQLRARAVPDRDARPRADVGRDLDARARRRHADRRGDACRGAVARARRPLARNGRGHVRRRVDLQRPVRGGARNRERRLRRCCSVRRASRSWRRRWWDSAARRSAPAGWARAAVAGASSADASERAEVLEGGRRAAGRGRSVARRRVSRSRGAARARRTRPRRPPRRGPGPPRSRRSGSCRPRSADRRPRGAGATRRSSRAAP